MAASVTCTGVVKDAVTGKCFINFSDGSQIEFASLTEMLEYRDDLDAPDGLGPDMARVLLIRRWLAQDPTASGSWIAGKTLTFDMTQNNPIRIQ